MMEIAICLVGALCVIYFAGASFELLSAASRRDRVVARGRQWMLRPDRRQDGRRAQDRWNSAGTITEVVDLQRVAPAGSPRYA